MSYISIEKRKTNTQSAMDFSPICKHISRTQKRKMFHYVLNECFISKNTTNEEKYALQYLCNTASTQVTTPQMEELARIMTKDFRLKNKHRKNRKWITQDILRLTVLNAITKKKLNNPLQIFKGKNVNSVTDFPENVKIFCVIPLSQLRSHLNNFSINAERVNDDQVFSFINAIRNFKKTTEFADIILTSPKLSLSLQWSHSISKYKDNYKGKELIISKLGTYQELNFPLLLLQVNPYELMQSGQLYHSTWVDVFAQILEHGCPVIKASEGFVNLTFRGNIYYGSLEDCVTIE